jgi:putative addiction module component (TIGR02574 family)
MSVTQKANDILKEALALPPEERATLAGSLIESLDTGVDLLAEEAWNKEIARRVDELDQGKAKTIPWEKVKRDISAKLDDGK